MDERNELPQLPKGWVWAAMEQIADLRLGKMLDQAKNLGTNRPYLRNKNVRWFTFDLTDVQEMRVTDNELHDVSIQQGDLVVCEGGEPGRSAVWGRNEPFVFQKALHRVRLKGNVSPNFVNYCLAADAFSGKLAKYFTGSTIKHFTGEKLRSFVVPLPPLLEQHRIVAKIEELFSDLDAGVAALQKTKVQLKRYRQAVLKAAVEGKLTAEWRAANAGKVEPASKLVERIRSRKDAKAQSKKQLAPVNAAELGELPESWAWARVAEIAEVRLGRQRSPKRAFGPNMRKYMRAANVTWNGLDLSDVKEMDFSPTEFQTYQLKRGDVLLGEASGSISEVGKPAVWNDQVPDCCFQNTLIRVRSHAPHPAYLHLHFFYDASAERFRKIAKGVGIHHLGAENLSAWIVSLPPLAEQEQIVAEVERRLSVADAIEKTVDASLKQAERLRQSILKRAFAGKLVPQDPSDEPAEKLLERIRAARQSKETIKPTRKSTVRQRKRRTKTNPRLFT